ncbi:MAG: hypothetical protein AB7N76_22990 [Planctomycetota bacterium]
MTRALAAGLSVLLLCGCGNLDVNPEGTLTTPLVVAPVSTASQPVVLACDRLGNLTINGEPLELPAAREDTRLGLRLVDVGELPAGWRPEHAREGGFLVTLLHKASPLAVRGLRPMDRVLALNGVPLTHAAEAQARMRDARRRVVSVSAVHPDGRRFELSAEAEDRVGESSKNHVPLVFEQRSSSLGQSFSFGPLDSVFYWRVLERHDYVWDPRQANSHYRDCFEWGALGNLVHWARERDPQTGQEKSRLRLFWLLSLGDDL